MTPFQLFKITGAIAKLPKKESKSCVFLLEYKHCSVTDAEFVRFMVMFKNQLEEFK